MTTSNIFYIYWHTLASRIVPLYSSTPVHTCFGRLGYFRSLFWSEVFLFFTTYFFGLRFLLRFPAPCLTNWWLDEVVTEQETTINSLKHRVLAFLYRRALALAKQDQNPFEIRQDSSQSGSFSIINFYLLASTTAQPLRFLIRKFLIGLH